MKLWDGLTALMVMVILPVLLAEGAAEYVYSIRAESIAQELQRAACVKHGITEEMLDTASGRLPGVPGGYLIRLEAQRAVFETSGVYYETVTDTEIRECLCKNGYYRIDSDDLFRVTTVRGGDTG